MSETKVKSLGSAIDEILKALEGLDPGVQLTALKTVSEHLTLPGIGAGVGETGEETRTPAVPKPPVTDIRTFRDEKQPSSLIEMVCVMAYYLQHLAPANERKDRVDVNDISKYFVQAGFQLPRVAKQVLVDAKDAGYLDALGGGQYRLNPVGHNLLTHSLPRQAGATSGPQHTHRRRPARPAKGAKPKKQKKKVQ
jgi:hypothetical protein